MYTWKESGRDLKLEAQEACPAGGVGGPTPSSQTPTPTSSFLYLQQRQLIYSRVVCVKNGLSYKNTRKARSELGGIREIVGSPP